MYIKNCKAYNLHAVLFGQAPDENWNTEQSETSWCFVNKLGLFFSSIILDKDWKKAWMSSQNYKIWLIRPTSVSVIEKSFSTILEGAVHSCIGKTRFEAEVKICSRLKLPGYVIAN